MAFKSHIGCIDSNDKLIMNVESGRRLSVLKQYQKILLDVVRKIPNIADFRSTFETGISKKRMTNF
jgi:hypothetical protein